MPVVILTGSDPGMLLMAAEANALVESGDLA